jgi:hypothetical protein
MIGVYYRPIMYIVGSKVYNGKHQKCVYTSLDTTSIEKWENKGKISK